jgi:Icc-related predicted phosphoesterase
MKIIYITDVHGDKDKYWRVLEVAKGNGATAVINGGDMLPKEGDLHQSQRDFVKGFLNEYFAEFEKARIYHLGFLGNDDLRIHDELFQEVCSKYPHVINLAQKRFQLESFEFIGMNWVVDYPFQLKDRCRKDQKD